MMEYEETMLNRESRPYALYNNWHLHYNLRNLERAEELFDQLLAEHGEFVRDFHIGNDELQPEILDAGPTDEEIQQMVVEGLDRSSDMDKKVTGPISIFVNHLLSMEHIWLLYFLAGAVLLERILVFVGLSVPCKQCGRVFCNACDLDPKASKTCQACNSIRLMKTVLDADLRREQVARQRRFGNMQSIMTMGANILFPGTGSLYRGLTGLGFLLVLVWSLMAGLIFSIDRMPRVESMPYFSHWTAMSVIVIIVLAAATYPVAIWSAIKIDKKRDDGTFRKS
jgi:hypothetical protein